MRMKVFRAASLADAISAARADMGSEAVILSSVRTSEGVELRAAVDPERARPRFFPNRRAGDGETAEEARTGARSAPPVHANGMPGINIRAALRHLLVQEGADELFAQSVAAAGANLGGANPSTALAGALQAMMNFAPIPAGPDRSIVLVGEAGSGRSLTAGKLALTAEIGGFGVELMSFEAERMGGRERVACAARRPLEAIFSPANPAGMLTEIAALRLEDTRFILDAPPLDLRAGDPFAPAREWADAADAEMVGVLSAQGHPGEMSDLVDRFKEAGIRRIILTRLDLSRKKAAALGAISRSRLSLAQLGMGLMVPGGLLPASAHRLVRILAGETSEPSSARGALS